MSEPRKVSYRRDVMTVSTGSVAFVFPEKLTETDYDDIAEWLVIIQRKLKRFTDTEPTPSPALRSGGDAE